MAASDLVVRAGRSIRFRSWRVYDNFLKALLFAWISSRRRWLRTEEEHEGVTVVTVTWNTADELDTLLRAIDEYTKRPVRIVVVDNASSDGSSALRTKYPEVEWLMLRRNWGHGLALDLGVQSAMTEFVIVMDVDAFPISDDWVDSVIDPLKEGHSLAGALSSGYIHPCYMAMRRHRFIDGKHTFAASYSRRLRIRRRGDPESWDAGQLITVREPGPHFAIRPTSVRGPGSLGTVFGELVYHHFYSARLSSTPTPDVIRSGVTLELSKQAWAEAVKKYLPERQPPPPAGT